MANNYFKDKFTLGVIISIVFIMLFVLFLSKSVTDIEIEHIKRNQYQTFSDNIKHEINIQIQNKKEINTLIALSLSKNTNFIKALEKNDPKLIRLKEFAKTVNRLTEYKNIWFQLIDKDGNSFYRSWTTKRGDSMLNARIDVKNMINFPRVKSTISVGKYDMTFKSMVPIYDDNSKFLGIFEIITHFNSIAKKLQHNHVDTIFLVDKKYKKQITRPFSKRFIGEYYVASLNPSDDILRVLTKEKIETLINSKKDFLLAKEANKLITVTRILDIKGDDMGYAIIFKSLNSFEDVKHNHIKQNSISFIVVFLLICVIVGYYIINKHHKEKLIIQHKKHEKDIVKNTKFFTIGQMAAGITHEINTPLTYIKGRTEMARFDLEDMPDNDFKKDLLDDNEKVMNGINRIALIVESMREMAQTTPTITDKANIYSTIITVLRMMHNRSKQISKIYINEEPFELETSDKDKYNFEASIHKQRIEQVWTIILNNAMDELIKIDNYDDRRIDIFVSYTSDNKVKVVFSDNAGGISDEIQDRIFEPFISTKESSGIGIGLNVAKKIIDEHGATIKAYNNNNKACFEILLSK